MAPEKAAVRADPSTEPVEQPEPDLTGNESTAEPCAYFEYEGEPENTYRETNSSSPNVPLGHPAELSSTFELDQPLPFLGEFELPFRWPTVPPG